MGNAKREGNAEAGSGPGQGRKGRFRLCDDPPASSTAPTPFPQPLRRGRLAVPGGPGSGLARVWGDVRHLHTPTHPRSCGNASWRVAQSRWRGGDVTHWGWPGWSRSVAGVIDGGRAQATAPQDAWGTCRSSGARG